MSMNDDKYKGQFWGSDNTNAERDQQGDEGISTSRRGSYWRRPSDVKSKNKSYECTSTLNVLLEDVMISSEKEIVPPDSIIFWKACYASVFYVLILIILVTFSVSLFWQQLTITAQTKDQPTYEWFKDNADNSLLCPCRQTQFQVSSFVKMDIKVWSTCTIFELMVNSLEDEFREKMDTMAEWLHISHACKQAHTFAAQDLALISESFIDSVYGLTENQLKTRVSILINGTRNTRYQAYQISYQQIKQMLLLDTRTGFKNDVRLYNLARPSSCKNNNCTTKSPSGRKLEDDFFFVQGSNRSCCYYDYDCIISKTNMTQSCMNIMLGIGDTQFGTKTSEMLLNTGFCNKLITHPQREQIDTTTRCSTFNTIEQYPTSALSLLVKLASPLDIGSDKLSSKTFGEAFSKGELAYVRFSVDTEKFFTKCNPNKCTYFVTDSVARLIQALALTFAIVSPILHVLKLVTVKIFLAIPDRYFTEKIDKVKSQRLELTSQHKDGTNQVTNNPMLKHNINNNPVKFKK
jgi:hypothetical protein